MRLFWEKVDATGPCWLWTAILGTQGYGQFAVNRRPRMAHRFSYELLVGPIPPGLVLDHLCRVRRCVNPDHLEPVTQAENVARGAGAKKERCHRGHSFSGRNLYIAPDGRRQCRACLALNQRAYMERRKAEV